MKIYICLTVVLLSFMKVWMREVLLLLIGRITVERFYDNSDFIVWGLQSYANELARNATLPCEVSMTYLAHLHEEVYGWKR